MTYPRKPVCYRLNGGPCQKGYQNVDCSTGEVYATPDDTAVLAGAVVTPCGGCPDELALSSTLKPALMCDGTATDILSAGPIQTVPHPDAVQRVMVCRPEGEFDREVAVWCHADTGETVTVVTLWPTDAAVSTAPVVETYTVGGAVWTGDRAKLTKCSPRDIEPVSQSVCVGGVPFTRTTFFNSSDQTTAGVVWQDATGSVVPAPAGVAVLGNCPQVTPVRVGWMRLEIFPWNPGEGAAPVGAVTGAQLVALFGPLLSVTVKMMRGQGLAFGAATPTGPMVIDQGETWSWSSHGSDQEDLLDPAFSLDANGGLMRVIVTYRAP